MKKHFLIKTLSTAFLILLALFAFKPITSFLKEWGEIEGCKKRIAVIESILSRNPEFSKIRIMAPAWGERVVLLSGCIEDSDLQMKLTKVTDYILVSGGFTTSYNFECPNAT